MITIERSVFQTIWNVKWQNWKAIDEERDCTYIDTLLGKDAAHINNNYWAHWGESTMLQRMNDFFIFLLSLLGGSSACNVYSINSM